MLSLFPFFEQGIDPDQVVFSNKIFFTCWQKRVVGTHEKHRIAVLLMSIHNMFSWTSKKNMYLVTPFIIEDLYDVI